MSPSRRKRRNLDKRAERLLAKLPGTIVAAPTYATPKSCAILLTERTAPIIVTRALIQPAVHTVGMHIDGLDEVLGQIAKSTDDDGSHYPVLILIDGWLQVAFTESFVLGRGGAA